MAEEQKFIVFNYVTSSVEQTDQAPQFGDPNAQLQAEVSSAYTGSVLGAVSLSAATPATPAVATLADPAAELVRVAQSSTVVSPAQIEQIQQYMGSLDAVGQLPSMITNMSSHANFVLENGTRVFGAIDRVFQPNQTGAPDRCATLTDFIGSVQGTYNDTLRSVTGGLNQITSALVAIPLTVITGFTTVVAGLITAIQTGVQTAINASITALNTVTTQLFGGLGAAVSGLISEVGGSITRVQQAIQGEIDRVAGALAEVTNNAFRLVVPNVNPCLRSVLNTSNSSNFELPPNLTSPDQTIAVPTATAARSTRPDAIPRWESPSGWINSAGYPVYPDGSPYQTSQRELWRLGLVDSPGPMPRT